MTIKASGRSVLILATGLFVCLAVPSPAAAAGADDKAVADTKSAGSEATEEPIAVKKHLRHGSRPWKRLAHRKSGKLALESSPAPAKRSHAADLTVDDGAISMPPAVANAKAQMASADAPDATNTLAGNAKAMSARANDILQAAPDKPSDTQPAADSAVVAPDQLNDVDRTLPTSATAAMAMASADRPAMENSDDSSTSDRTSLIGKIFIACGGLLTLASAARMFMA
jgi:hypothetical protein